MIRFSTGSFWKIFRRFLKNINSPYKISIVNEISMEEVLGMHLTKKGVYILLSTILMSLFLIFSALIFFTPLKYYIPGSNKEISRIKLIELKQLADSLTKVNELREQYIYNLISVANGNVSKQRDTNGLTQREIEIAILNNNSKIDHASRYDYLKVKKVDTSNNETEEPNEINNQSVDKENAKGLKE